MKTFFIVCAVFCLAVGVSPQSSTQSPQTSTSQSEAQGSAAAKAAERKRRFEEEKQRIEGQQRVETPPCTDGKPAIYITPTTAAMLVGESRTFDLSDTKGQHLTSAAEWSISDSYRIALKPGIEPTITAKNEGTFKVTARIDTRTAEATIKVYPGNELPIGTVRWSVAPMPCFGGHVTQIVPAVPH